MNYLVYGLVVEDDGTHTEHCCEMRWQMVVVVVRPGMMLGEVAREVVASLTPMDAILLALDNAPGP